MENLVTVILCIIALLSLLCIYYNVYSMKMENATLYDIVDNLLSVNEYNRENTNRLIMNAVHKQMIVDKAKCLDIVLMHSRNKTPIEKMEEPVKTGFFARFANLFTAKNDKVLETTTASLAQETKLREENEAKLNDCSNIRFELESKIIDLTTSISKIGLLKEDLMQEIITLKTQYESKTNESSKNQEILVDLRQQILVLTQKNDEVSKLYEELTREYTNKTNEYLAKLSQEEKLKNEYLTKLNSETKLKEELILKLQKVELNNTTYPEKITSLENEKNTLSENIITLENYRNELVEKLKAELTIKNTIANQLLEQTNANAQFVAQLEIETNLKNAALNDLQISNEKAQKCTLESEALTIRNIALIAEYEKFKLDQNKLLADLQTELEKTKLLVDSNISKESVIELIKKYEEILLLTNSHFVDTIKKLINEYNSMFNLDGSVIIPRDSTLQKNRINNINTFVKSIINYYNSYYNSVNSDYVTRNADRIVNNIPLKNIITEEPLGANKYTNIKSRLEQENSRLTQADTDWIRYTRQTKDAKLQKLFDNNQKMFYN